MDEIDTCIITPDSIYSVYQMIAGELPNTNTCVVGSNGERMSNKLMFYVSQGLMKRFSGSFLISDLRQGSPH